MNKLFGALFLSMVLLFSFSGCDKSPSSPELKVLAAPVIDSVVPGEKRVIVYWSPVQGATSYTLYYSKDSTVSISSASVTLDSVTSPDTIRGLQYTSTYAFGITANNASGSSALSPVKTATTWPSPTIIVSSPKTDSIYHVGDTVDITWQYINSSDNGFYTNIKVSIDNGTTFTLLDAIAHPAGPQTYKWVIDSAFLNQEAMIWITHYTKPMDGLSGVFSITQ